MKIFTIHLSKASNDNVMAIYTNWFHVIQNEVSLSQFLERLKGVTPDLMRAVRELFDLANEKLKKFEDREFSEDELNDFVGFATILFELFISQKTSSELWKQVTFKDLIVDSFNSLIDYVRNRPDGEWSCFYVNLIVLLYLFRWNQGETVYQISFL